MDYVDVYKYARIVEQVVGDLHIAAKAKPNPWFCKDIFLPKDLQWAGYIGDFSTYSTAMVFGINLEFRGAWDRVRRQIKKNLPLFSELLCKHKDLEWHWMSCPTQRSENPPIRHIYPKLWTYQVDYVKWFDELEDILDNKKHLRPQIQVMRLIGLPEDKSNTALIKQNVEKTVLDLQPLVDFLFG
jgi:hypothetical protein